MNFKDMKSELKEFRKKQKEEYQKFRTNIFLKHYFPDAKYTYPFSSYKGNCGGVEFSCTCLEDILELLDKYPPIPMVLIQERIPRFVFKSGTEEFCKQHVKGDYLVFDILPLTITLDRSPTSFVVVNKLKYFTEIQGKVIEMSIEIRLDYFGRVHGDYKEYLGGFRIENCKVHKTELTSGFDYQMWGRGGNDTYNSATLWSTSITLQGFKHRLKNKEKELNRYEDRKEEAPKRASKVESFRPFYT